MRTVVWSYGGGVQSVAIGVLIAQGRLPRPDLAVIADTGREAASTWAYLREHMQPLLDRAGGPKIEVAAHALATVDLYAKNGDLLIPAYTTSGALPTFCSNEWKRRVVARWLRAHGVRDCDLWLGITIDELERARTSEGWMRNAYPLLFLAPMTRADCLALIGSVGLPAPAKSACYMCPFRSDAEWRQIRDDAPDEWTRAVELDERIRRDDPGVFLHRSRVPLREARIDAAVESAQLDLFCGSGMCWT